jgi:Flp pilus assembly pilin Flp
MQERLIDLQLHFAILVARLERDVDGQGLTEYALILALVAVVAVAAAKFYSGKLTTELSTVASSV